jgi:hypothetical protein
MQKKTYHPLLIITIGYKTGIVLQNIGQQLPRSTNYHWQQKNLENTFGHCWHTANQKQLAVLKQVYQNKKLIQLNMNYRS